MCSLKVGYDKALNKVKHFGYQPKKAMKESINKKGA